MAWEGLTGQLTTEASRVSITDRLVDAVCLWRVGRREGGLLLAMVAVAAAARQAHPGVPDHRGFVAHLKSRHTWTIAVEFRGKSWDLDELFYTWLRCELVHAARLPVDIRIDDALSGLEVRAGGPPEYVVLIAPDWFDFFVQAASASSGS
jgi:hypothetical protein